MPWPRANRRGWPLCCSLITSTKFLNRRFGVITQPRRTQLDNDKIISGELGGTVGFAWLDLHLFERHLYCHAHGRPPGIYLPQQSARLILQFDFPLGCGQTAFLDDRSDPMLGCGASPRTDLANHDAGESRTDGARLGDLESQVFDITQTTLDGIGDHGSDTRQVVHTACRVDQCSCQWRYRQSSDFNCFGQMDRPLDDRPTPAVHLAPMSDQRVQPRLGREVPDAVQACCLYSGDHGVRACVCQGDTRLLPQGGAAVRKDALAGNWAPPRAVLPALARDV